MNDWQMSLQSWIIQDGNYPDFVQWQTTQFALEFGPAAYAFTDKRDKAAQPLGEACYKVIAEVVFLASTVWVLDFGICAYHEAKPPSDIREGAFIEANIWLGVDPFFYFEQLHALRNMPPLIYTWRLKQILMQTAPFAATKSSEGRWTSARDDKQRDWREIDRTNAWTDDSGSGDYLLTCAKLNSAPTKKRSTVL